MWLNERSGLILQPGHSKIPALGNAILDIAESALAQLDTPGNAFIPTGGHWVARPRDEGADSGAALPPLSSNSTKVVGKDIGCPAAVLPDDNDDLLVRQLEARITLLDARIIP